MSSLFDWDYLRRVLIIFVIVILVLNILLVDMILVDFSLFRFIYFRRLEKYFVFDLILCVGDFKFVLKVFGEIYLLGKL